jgi:hypothetical protein
MAARPFFALLVALLVAAGPMLGSPAGMQAGEAHAAMAMTDGAEHGCCEHEDSSTAKLCFAHCAAGVIDSSPALAPATAIAAAAVPMFVRRVASRAPPPETTPPKSSAA